jgi:hypothetical protein
LQLVPVETEFLVTAPIRVCQSQPSGRRGFAKASPHLEDAAMVIQASLLICQVLAYVHHD